MLNLLAKLVGPSRAVSAYVAIKRFGIPIGLLIAFGLVFGVIVTLSRPDRMEHVSYFTAEVISMSPLIQDSNAGVFIDVRLPNGEVLKLTETEGSISGNLTDVACMEERRDTQTGEISYRLRRAHRCAG